jgi:hypothetical protein
MAQLRVGATHTPSEEGEDEPDGRIGKDSLCN